MCLYYIVINKHQTMKTIVSTTYIIKDKNDLYLTANPDFPEFTSDPSKAKHFLTELEAKEKAKEINDRFEKAGAVDVWMKPKTVDVYCMSTTTKFSICY